METAAAKKTISKKRTFTIARIGEATTKGNITLMLIMREGLIKQYLYLLTDAENAEGLSAEDDITDLIPQNIKIRESELNNADGEGNMTKSSIKWIELL
jgi:hypothetical protein